LDSLVEVGKKKRLRVEGKRRDEKCRVGRKLLKVTKGRRVG